MRIRSSTSSVFNMSKLKKITLFSFLISISCVISWFMIPYFFEIYDYLFPPKQGIVMGWDPVFGYYVKLKQIILIVGCLSTFTFIIFSYILGWSDKKIDSKETEQASVPNPYQP
jgi:hypothetical protein